MSSSDTLSSQSGSTSSPRLAPPSPPSLSPGASKRKRDESSPIESLSKKAKHDDKPPKVQCLVCKKLTRSPVYSCATGNRAFILCRRCRRYFKACRTCKRPKYNPYPYCEELTKNRFKCKCFEAGAGAGSNEDVTPRIVEHLPLCPFREVQCHQRHCYETIQFQNYPMHLMDDHEKGLYPGPKFTRSYTYNEHKSNPSTQTLVKFDEQEFIAHTRFTTRSKLLFIWLSVMGDQALADKYTCQVNLKSPESSNFGCAWKLPVLPLHEIPKHEFEAKLFGRSAVASIPLQAVSSLGKKFQGQDVVSFRVTYELKKA